MDFAMDFGMLGQKMAHRKNQGISQGLADTTEEVTKVY